MIRPLLILSFAFSQTLFARPLEVWREDSDPSIMSYYFTKKFSELPLSGKVNTSSYFWSGDYWALNKGNINYRWYARRKVGFNYHSPTKNEAKAWTISELAELSPSEKYDLFTGNYQYPLKQEVGKIADPNALIWEGICHGYSPASMNHREPRPKLMVNPDGIEIPFGSTDIKALLSYYYAYAFRSPDTHQVARRCFKAKPTLEDIDCHNDLNAGAFHLILANRLGREKKGFIADIERYEQVWNHPFVSYNSQVLSEKPPRKTAAPGTIQEVWMRTKIEYVDRNGHDWHPVIGTSKQSYKTITYEYALEIDNTGSIIGGEWLSSRRPDFLWYTLKPRQFEGTLHRLGELLNDE